MVMTVAGGTDRRGVALTGVAVGRTGPRTADVPATPTDWGGADRAGPDVTGIDADAGAGAETEA
jgi:hypothetical protein